MYQNYIFDLYGTLADIHTNENKHYLWVKMAELYSALGAFYEPGDLKKEYRRLCKEKFEQEQFPVPYPYYELDLMAIFEKLFEDKGISVHSDTLFCVCNTFRIISRSYIRVYPGIMDLLQTLKAQDKKIYLLTNAQACFTLPELRITGLHPYFDGMVISSEVAVCKPDPVIMYALLDRYNLNKNESIMIGNDKTSDIMIANQCEMDSLYIHSNLSPQITDEYMAIPATYEIMDGDFAKMKKVLR